MTEYGIFNDEGCIEQEFYDRDTAMAWMVRVYPDDDAHVAEVCPNHEGQEREHCEECESGEEDES